MEGSSRGNRSRRRAPASSRQYDIVTSAYVIGELDTDEERRSVVDTLWASTKHLLILVEPGTPIGYANIMAARTQVLQASMEEESGKLGAHVVAPCPHDGICPMEGSRSWCHFAQRFERSSLQRITKIRPDGGMPRTYQDERYSYVVIRKQPRPEVSGALSVSRHRQDAAELDSHTPYLPHPQSWRKNESKMRQAAALQKILDGMQDTEDAVEDGPSLEETTEQLIRESLQAGGDEDEDIELYALEDEKLTVEEATDAQELASMAAEDDEFLPSENEKEGNPELSGIEDIQLGLPQDEGVKDTESLQAVSKNPDSDSDGEDSMVSSQMVAAAAADSWSWGRLIRHPRKRSKHVIFDTCAAKASVPPSSIPLQASRRVTERRRKGDRELGQEGALVRQVITRSDRQTWLGPAGYRLARKARWGDLWPTHYAQGSGS